MAEYESISREDWEKQYEDAVQWRDWMTCDLLLEQREEQTWYTASKFEEDQVG